MKRTHFLVFMPALFVVAMLPAADVDGTVPDDARAKVQRIQNEFQKVAEDKALTPEQKANAQAGLRREVEALKMNQEQLNPGAAQVRIAPLPDNGPGNDVAAHLIPQSSRLSVKLPSGAEIEVDGGVLNETPELMQWALGELADTAVSGVLVYHLDDVTRMGLVDKSKGLIAKIAPTVTMLLNADLKLLVVTSEDIPQLRRAEAVLNAVFVPAKIANRPDRPGPQPFGRGMDPEQMRDQMLRRMGLDKGQGANPGDPVQPRKLKLGAGPDEKKPDLVKDNF